MKRLVISLGIVFLLLQPCLADNEVTVDGVTVEPHLIQDEGTNIKPKSILNFVGAGVSAANSGNKTVVTINGGGVGSTYASDITTTTTSFNNNLSASDTTVQKALDTLDNLVAGSGSVSDDAYSASWDNVTDIAPSQNAVYDALSTLPGGHDAVTVTDSSTVDLTASGQDITASVIENGLEAILDLQDLQGAVTDTQVPDNITITETDPVFSVSDASGITSGDILNWNTAYGWGDWGGEGFITGADVPANETDPIWSAASGNYLTVATAQSDYLTIASADAVYLTSEVDPTVDTSAEIMTILGNEAITLGTNTVGNYVATIADSGAGEITVASSGMEDAAVTLAIASSITRDTEWDTSAELTAVLGDIYLFNAGDTCTGALTINDNNGAGSTLLTIGDATDADSAYIYGDLTVAGDDLTMGTNTAGYILVADGTNFNPVLASGDATIGTTGLIAIVDDSHNHTTTTISGLDISNDTNLAGTANQIVLTDDTLSLVLNKDLVTTAPLTGGTDNILIGADSDITIAIPAATSTAAGYLASADWITFNSKMAGDLLGDIVATAPILIDGGTNVDNILPGADVDRTISINLLKDLVTTSPLQGGTDNILPGTDSDVTLTLQVSGDVVATAPVLIDGTTAVNDILVGGDTDRTISINMLGDLATTAPITGAVNDIFPGTDGAKATIGITLSKDLVTTAPLTGGTDDIFPGADADITIAIPAGSAAADGYITSGDWVNFNSKQAGDADLTTYAGITPSANAQTLLGETFAQMQASMSIDDLITLSGMAEGSVNLSTFTGTTINDNLTIKAALQALETAVEGKQASDSDLTTWAGITPGANVGTFLATPSSANLAAAVTDETGSGLAVFATSPTLTTPVISSIVNTGTINLPTASDTLVGRATTDTLTNKRITRRITTLTSSATPTVNTDNTDMVTITALATAITSMTTNLSGTPSAGDRLIYRIKDDGTARAIAWGASFASRGVTLPTTTVLSKYLYVGFIWNEVTSTWDCIAAVEE